MCIVASLLPPIIFLLVIKNSYRQQSYTVPFSAGIGQQCKWQQWRGSSRFSDLLPEHCPLGCDVIPSSKLQFLKWVERTNGHDNQHFRKTPALLELATSCNVNCKVTSASVMRSALTSYNVWLFLLSHFTYFNHREIKRWRKKMSSNISL